MKNLNIILIVGAVLLLGGLIFASSLVKDSNKENKNPLVLAPDQKVTQQEANTESKMKIEIANFAFSPNELTVKPGEVITVTNKDTIKHTLTSDTNLFKTELLGKGESAEIKAPMQAGEYKYHCQPHPNMTGKIIVKE